MIRVLKSRYFPVVPGLFSALIILWVWGSLKAFPILHDEAAYLLQAQIFAHWRWSAPAPPLPEFFEQYHVLVTPVLASKYPPGHSILLTPGIWVGLPSLVPLLLVGVAGGLLFALARRFANPIVALLTWLIWTTSPGNLWFLPSYLSQNSTVVLWLLGWWALAQWRDQERGYWLVLLAACVAWGALTRPFTTVSYAVAAGIVVARELVRHRGKPGLAPAIVTTAIVLALIPVWSLRTTGSLTTPYSLYSRIYFPYQRPGFGSPLETSSRRDLPPDMVRYAVEYRAMHAAYGLSSVPEALKERLGQIAADTWGGRRWPLALFIVLGFFAVPYEGLFALGTGAVLVLSHLAFAHPAVWSVYYLELQAPLAFSGAVGLWAAVSMIALRQRPSVRQLASTPSRPAALVTMLAITILAGSSAGEVEKARVRRLARSTEQDHFRKLVASIPASKVIVFVRYVPSHNFNFSLIANDPYLANARTWIVCDRGADNARLIGIAPDRAPYLFDEGSQRLFRIRLPARMTTPPGNF